MVTDTKLVEHSHFLENALQTGNFSEYCNYKIETSSEQTHAFIWRFIQASFDATKKEKFLELLGFNSATLDDKLKSILKDIHVDKAVEQIGKSLNSSLALNGTSNVFDHLGGGTFQASDNIQDDSDDTFNDIARSMSPVNLSFKNGSFPLKRCY